LFNDTEVCVVTDDAELARDTRVRLWAEHLQLDRAAVGAAGARSLVDEHWIPIAREQLRRRESGATPTHRLLMLPASHVAQADCSDRSRARSTTVEGRNHLGSPACGR
jgi:hypothetical protein